MDPTHDSTFTSDESGSAAGGEGVPFLVFAMRAEAPLAPSWRFALGGIDEVLIGRGGGESVEATPSGRQLILRIPDRWLSTEHARLARERGRFHLVDLGAKNGSYRQGMRVTRSVLSDGDVLELGHSFFVYRGEQPPMPDLMLHGLPDPLCSLQPRLTELAARVEAAAASSLPLMIFGETGTGKELVAQSVHARSRRAGPFVPVNCGALPAALIESELFGHRKGAFSGALEDRPGLVRASDGGTLFLDEVGELPPAAQVALLRVVQESAVRPLGAVKDVPVDLRVIAATHRDLEAMVAEGTFRADLLARLNGLSVEIPPLRQRREDLGLIVAALLGRHAPDRVGLTLSLAMARALFQREWTRNVRELELWLAASLALHRDGQPLESASGEAAREPSAAPRELPAADRVLRERLVVLLTQHGGNVTAVARELGKAREQVYRWIERCSLDPADYRSR